MDQKLSPLLIPSEIGSMRLRLSDDILHVHSDGKMDLETTKQITAVYQTIIARFGYLLLRLDLSQSTGIDLEARKYAVEWGKHHLDVQATAATGAALIVRMFIGLMHRATQIVGKNTGTELHFCSSEEEAVEWLSQQRPRLLAAAAKRRPTV